MLGLKLSHVSKRGHRCAPSRKSELLMCDVMASWYETMKPRVVMVLTLSSLVAPVTTKLASYQLSIIFIDVEVSEWNLSNFVSHITGHCDYFCWHHGNSQISVTSFCSDYRCQVSWSVRPKVLQKDVYRICKMGIEGGRQYYFCCFVSKVPTGVCHCVLGVPWLQKHSLWPG